MFKIRPLLTTLASLPIAFSPSIAKNANEIKDVALYTAQKTKLTTDVFQSSATKISKEIKPTLAVKSATQINSRTALSVEELNEALNSLLPKKHISRNPFKNKASVFIEMGEKYDVNPITIIAIAMHESGRGISSGALKKNNIGGIMGRGGLRRYESVDSCIEAMAKLLQKHVQNGRSTVSKLGYSGKYCAKSASRNWVKDVQFYIKKLESFKSSTN